MLRIRKILSALLSAVLLLWYVSPDVYALLHGPEATDQPMEWSAPALSTGREGAVYTRVAGDERLTDKTASSTVVRLFGTVPIRSIRVVSEGTQVLAMGNAIGIVLHTEGVQVIGFSDVKTDSGTVNPSAAAGLCAGDTILSVNGIPIQDSNRFADACKSEKALTLRCQREGKIFTVSVTPVADENGVPRIGAWVRDSTSGIGTLSFVDPTTDRFAALGHGISDVDTGVLLSYGSGAIYPASIIGVQRASNGRAGELSGTFSTDPKDGIGTLTENTAFGISGILYGDYTGTLYPIADAGEIVLGDAEILSTVSGTEVRSYRVRVIRTEVQASAETNGMMIEIIDPELLRATGGIVQGMSGSPVLQNGKLIGVVTHVFLNDSRRGYCIYANLMYEKLR